METKGTQPFAAQELSSQAKKDVIIEKQGDEGYIVQATAGIRLDKLKKALQPSSTSPNTLPGFDESTMMRTALSAEAVISCSNLCSLSSVLPARKPGSVVV